MNVSLDWSSRPKLIPLLVMTLGWFASLIVGVVIGATLIMGGLALPFVPSMVSVILGWFVLVMTTLASLLWFFDNE